MTKNDLSAAVLWARFRFAVVGPLLSAPPARGDFRAALRALADKVWLHPTTGQDVQFSMSTIERWYYKARNQRQDPLCVLRRAVRKDAGRVRVVPQIAELLRGQYGAHPHWSYQLHYDNLRSLLQQEPTLGTCGSYSTIRRFMQSQGLVRRRRPSAKRPGEQRAVHRREQREIRSFEAEYVGSLWHLDFHHGSLPVNWADGRQYRPLALGILDDHSRLCCHLQWYLTETTEDLVHGFSQAIQKRGLPRALLSDNGAAMLSEEFTTGLLELGILHEKTLPYSPYQNGKQERLWSTLEGRLMEMLDGVELTLDFLNRATQAWAEIEYNRALHRELATSPWERFQKAPDVLRASPSSQVLRQAFRLRTTRRQRQTDGTISLEGIRFEIPSRFRHFREVTVRYARWNLGQVDIVDPRSGAILAPLHALDRVANAQGRRLFVEPTVEESSLSAAPSSKSLPPLLQRILDQYARSGQPPAYVPKHTQSPKGDA